MAKQGIFSALEQQAAKATSVPYIKSLPPVSTSTGSKELKRFIVVIEEDTIYPVVSAGDFVFVESIVLSATLATTGIPPVPYLPLTVKSDTENVSRKIIARNQNFHFATPFNKLEISNAFGNGQITLVIWVGFGEIKTPLLQTAALRMEISATVAVAIAGAYAVGDAVGTGGFSFGGFFPSGFRRATITRARLLTGSPTTANASFRAWFYSGDSVPAASTDHTPYNVDDDPANNLLPPLVFPSFVALNASNACCDLADFRSVVQQNSVDPTNSSLYVQLQALAAYVSINPQTFRLNLAYELEY